MRKATVILAVCAFRMFCGTAASQTLTMGNGMIDFQNLNVSGVQTFVDLVRPATASGTIESASLGWSQFPCSAAVKIKVLRREGDTLALVAERGPFDVVSVYAAFPLSPPIEVAQGDLIGLSRVSDCGGPQATFLTGNPSEGFAQFVGDITSPVPYAGGGGGGGFLQVAASGPATEMIARVLPAAGSTPGAFESFFRTAIQLSNTGTATKTGRLVYHAAGHTSSPEDPSLPFSIEPFSTVAYPDVVATMGQEGLGTLDVAVPVTSGSPLVTARIYEDNGEEGTAGFTEDAIDPVCCTDARVLFIRSTSYLVAPADPAHFRYNVGIRSLFKAPTLTFSVVGSGTSVTRSYPPSSFEQRSAEELLGAPLPPNALIAIQVDAGTAIVYGATVDNVTNDASIQFASVAFTSPN